MTTRYTSSLRTLFLVHAIVALVFGLVYLLIPVQFGALVNWSIPTTGTSPYRLLGAALLGFGLASWLAYTEAAWDRVRIIVIMEIGWTILGTLVTVWGLLSGELPAFAWVNAALLAAFGVAFYYQYSRK